MQLSSRLVIPSCLSWSHFFSSQTYIRSRKYALSYHSFKAVKYIFLSRDGRPQREKHVSVTCGSRVCFLVAYDVNTVATPDLRFVVLVSVDEFWLLTFVTARDSFPFELLIPCTINWKSRNPILFLCVLVTVINLERTACQHTSQMQPI